MISWKLSIYFRTVYLAGVKQNQNVMRAVRCEIRNLVIVAGCYINIDIDIDIAINLY